jgi:hypothetical protein
MPPFLCESPTRSMIQRDLQTKTVSPNQITGPNAGGLCQFPIRTPLAARVGQFCRSAEG